MSNCLMYSVYIMNCMTFSVYDVLKQYDIQFVFNKQEHFRGKRFNIQLLRSSVRKTTFVQRIIYKPMGGDLFAPTG